MNIKPKEILVNLPIVLTFQQSEEISDFAVTINTIIHGKSKLKYEVLGILDEKYIGLFYMNRNNEYIALRKEFLHMIEVQEVMKYRETSF
jgi:hypothetical protein